MRIGFPQYSHGVPRGTACLAIATIGIIARAGSGRGTHIDAPNMTRVTVVLMMIHA